MKVISFANHKGGVGKTSSVASIGAALSKKGFRTLLIDTDAQANLTCSLTDTEGKTIYNSLKDGEPLPIIQLSERLSIVPSSEELALLELEVASKIGREYLLADLIEPLKEKYDYILIDCPPSLGLLTLNAFVASTDIIIVLTAETLPTKGLSMITDGLIDNITKRANKKLKLSGILITRWESTKLNKTIEESLRAKYGELVYKTKIRKNTALAESPLYRESIFTYAPSSNGAKDYSNVTEEIIKQR